MILEIYASTAGLFLFATALTAFEGQSPKEITDFYSWLFYGLLFPLPLLKAFIRFMYNIIKL